MRILTTTTKPNFPEWGRRTELLAGWKEKAEHEFRTKQPASIWSDLKWAWKLFQASKNYDAVITGFERAAWLFVLLRRLVFAKYPPHIFLDAHPVLSTNPIFRTIRRLIFKQVFLGSDRTVVFSHKQKQLWKDLFKVPSRKFYVIPYWATALTENVSSSSAEMPLISNYVFAGGDEERDYKTLIEVMRELPQYKCYIAAFRQDHFNGIEIPYNVQIVTLSHDAFLKTLAGAGCVVVPLKKDTIRFAGQQTYLNAMLMRKPTIVCDISAVEYISHQVDGYVIGSGDKDSLKHYIRKALSDKKEADAMGQRAYWKALDYTPQRYFNSILTLAELLKLSLIGKKPIGRMTEEEASDVASALAVESDRASKKFLERWQKERV